MCTFQPNIVVLGGIESGKTSTIQKLWEDVVTDYSCESGIHHFSISENIEGRDIVNFNVFELPRIKYSSPDWLHQEGIKDCLEHADVILYVLTCDEVAINARRTYMEKMLNKLSLKKNTVLLIAYGMADWVLFPEAAKNFMIPDNTSVSLDNMSTLLKKVNLVHSEFGDFAKYDPTFNVASVIPYSNVVNWNFDELKHKIWNGIVLGLNTSLFDDSIPTIVLSGKTGSGKTSTINALWDKNLATNRIASCTKFPAVMHICDTYNGSQVEFNLVDLPGIAESMEANSLYRNFYYHYISKASLVLCLTQADRRAYKQDQIFYGDLISNGILRKTQQIVLGINQADLLFKSADNFDGIDLHTVSDDDAIIVDKVKDFYDNVFSDIFSDFDNVSIDAVEIYSVFHNWHLDKLKNKLYKLIF